jgi:hypothetical protein
MLVKQAQHHKLPGDVVVRFEKGGRVKKLMQL